MADKRGIQIHAEGDLKMITSHPLGWLLWKKQKVINVGKDAEKLELLSIIGGNVK